MRNWPRGDAGPVDVAALLRAVVAMAQDLPRANGARIALPTPVRRGRHAESDYFVLGHDSRLAQVVTNLIDNACSFSEPGGVVRVALQRTAPGGGESGEDRVVITVDDEGPGIPPHAIERIFERFYTDRPNQGFGQNSGPWPVDIAPDRRGAWRPYLGDEPRGGDGEPRRCRSPADWMRRMRQFATAPGARFVVELPAFPR